MHRVLVPADNQSRDLIPKGAALVEVGRGRAVCVSHPHDSFAERCHQALTGAGRMVTLDFETVEVGRYDDYDGELRLGHHGAASRLEQWLGQRVYRGDLEARDNRSSRRAQARRLSMQGRTAEAFRLDRRLGL